MTRRSKTLTDQMNEAFVEVNPGDAKKLGVANGDVIKVKSRRGEIKVKVWVTEKVKKGVVFIPFHFSEAAVNALTNPALDPIAKIPEFKVCSVSLEKIS